MRRRSWGRSIGVALTVGVLALSSVGSSWAQEQVDASWGLDRISHKVYAAPYTYAFDAKAGDGVYVLSTGIDTAHPDLGDRASTGFNAVADTDEDENGRGTFLAGLAAGTTHGVAKKAKIVSVKVLNKSGSGSTSAIVKGMNWVAENAHGPSVVLFGVGVGRSSAIDAAVDDLFNAGIVVVAAAGNQSQDSKNVSPAGAPNAITVAAIDSTNTIAGFSNWGTGIDVFAPGVKIVSDAPGGGITTPTSGTDAAAAYAAGMAAYYLSLQPDATPTDITGKVAHNAVIGQVKGNVRGSANRILYNNYA